MVRLIIKCSLILGIALTLHLALLLIPFPAEQSAYFGASIDKQVMLQNHPDGSIIIVGGSSAAFAYDSAYMQSELDKPVINTGLHAGLGLRYMLDSVIPYVQPDDIILLNLEYEHYVKSPDIWASDALRRVIAADPLQNISLLKSSGQLQTVVTYHSEYTVNSIWNYLLQSSNDCPGNLYCRSSFDKYGDVTSDYLNNTEATHQSFQAELDNYDPSELDQSLNQNAIDLLNNFNQTINQRNARLLIILPVLPDSVYQQTSDYLDHIAQELVAETSIQIMNEPFAYSDTLFLDTVYHLNNEGRQAYTVHITELLTSQLNP